MRAKKQANFRENALRNDCYSNRKSLEHFKEKRIVENAQAERNWEYTELFKIREKIFFLKTVNESQKEGKTLGNIKNFLNQQSVDRKVCEKS